MDDREIYYLTDPETGRRDPEPEKMTWEEALRRNGFLKRQQSRYRWMKPEAEQKRSWDYGN